MRSNRRERKICFGLAAWAAIYMTFFHFNPPKGYDVAPIWKLAVMLGAVVVFVGFALKTNRLVASLGGLLCVYIRCGRSGPSSGYFLPSVPLLALMMWLSFRISGDRRKLTEEKAASGDFGMDPRKRAELNRKAKKEGPVRYRRRHRSHPRPRFQALHAAQGQEEVNPDLTAASAGSCGSRVDSSVWPAEPSGTGSANSAQPPEHNHQRSATRIQPPEFSHQSSASRAHEPEDSQRRSTGAAEAWWVRPRRPAGPAPRCGRRDRRRPRLTA